jgi:selenocysteine lyase/cysteine desulfurase
MGAARLPANLDPLRTKHALLERYHIEIPITRWGDANLVRLSVQGYTSETDCDALVQALGELARQAT